MPLTQEQFETLPDFVKSDYVQHEGAYVPQAELKVKGLKSSLDNLGSKLREIEAGKAAEIEAARAKGLEEAKTKGDVAEVEKRYQEQMEDAVKRAREDERNSVTKELSQKQADTKASGIADTISASLACDAKSEKALRVLIKARVKTDPLSGDDYFLDDNGSALSVKRDEFEAMLRDEFPHLVKAAIATNGAGGANGNNSGSAFGMAGKVDGSKKERAAYYANKFKIPN